MSPTKTTKIAKRSLTLWLLLCFLGIAAAWFFFNRQWLIDTIRYYQFTPTTEVAALAKDTTMTETGKFYFYTSHPKLADSKSFNNECVRKEADSPILGCYYNFRIYIYDVRNDKLDGIEEVTAAHEMLHAVFDRLSDAEREQLSTELLAAYERVKTSELVKRMEYYEKNEPGQEVNELYAILGTEFLNLGSKLEEHYERYFSDRKKIVVLHNKTQAVFKTLTARAKTIADQINNLVDSINTTTKQYNKETAELSAAIEAFNAKANTQNGFSSQSEFDAERSALLAQLETLKAKRAKIEKNLARYDKLRSQLEAVAAESDALNQSIDSTLAPATKL